MHKKHACSSKPASGGLWVPAGPASNERSYIRGPRLWLACRPPPTARRLTAPPCHPPTGCLPPAAAAPTGSRQTPAGSPATGQGRMQGQGRAACRDARLGGSDHQARHTQDGPRALAQAVSTSRGLVSHACGLSPAPTSWFITNGPCCTMGSPMGRPAISRNLRPASPAAACTCGGGAGEGGRWGGRSAAPAAARGWQHTELRHCNVGACRGASPYNYPPTHPPTVLPSSAST